MISMVSWHPNANNAQDTNICTHQCQCVSSQVATDPATRSGASPRLVNPGCAGLRQLTAWTARLRLPPPEPPPPGGALRPCRARAWDPAPMHAPSLSRDRGDSCTASADDATVAVGGASHPVRRRGAAWGERPRSSLSGHPSGAPPVPVTPLSGHERGDSGRLCICQFSEWRFCDRWPIRC